MLKKLMIIIRVVSVVLFALSVALFVLGIVDIFDDTAMGIVAIVVGSIGMMIGITIFTLSFIRHIRLLPKRDGIDLYPENK